MFIINKDSVTITDCYIFKMADIEYIIKRIMYHDECPDVVRLRGFRSLENEILTHKLLYKLHILRSRTKDCDLDEENPFTKFGYFLIGNFYRLFTK